MFSTNQPKNTNTLTISVTRGLKMLKTLEERVKKTLDDKVFVTHSTGGKRKVISHKAQESIDYAKDNLQKLKDLVAMRDAVKEAILKANMTQLEIDNVGVHTVAFWIEKKSSLDNIEGLIKRNLSSKLSRVRDYVDSENNRHETVIADLLSKQFSGSGASSTGAQSSIVNSYWDNHKAEVIDPAEIGKYVEEVGDYMQKIKDEIDTALQEHNAKTMIEVEQPKSIVL